MEEEVGKEGQSERRKRLGEGEEGELSGGTGVNGNLRRGFTLTSSRLLPVNYICIAAAAANSRFYELDYTYYTPSVRVYVRM